MPKTRVGRLDAHKEWKSIQSCHATPCSSPGNARTHAHKTWDFQMQQFVATSLQIMFFKNCPGNDLAICSLSLRVWCFLGSTSQRWKVSITDELAYRRPAGHGVARSRETERSRLQRSRILSPWEWSHGKTPYESTQRSQLASFDIFWSSDGWSTLIQRISPNDASIVEYRGVADIRTPPATSKILLKNQWPLTKKNNVKELFKKPNLHVNNRLDLQQRLLKVLWPCAKGCAICWRRNDDV